MTRPPADDVGVSNVLGAILVFGLLVITLVVVQTRFVPVWDEEREASHMQELTTQLGQIKSDLDRQVDNRTDVAIANPLTLQQSGGFRFFSGARLPGEVGFVPSAPGGGLTFDSPRMTVLRSGDQSFLGLADQDDWIALTTPEVLEDITLVRALRLRIDMDEDVCSTYQDDDTATLIVEDAGGDEVGRATTTWIPASSSEKALKIDIFANFDGEPVADDPISSDSEFFFSQLCQGGQDNFLDYNYFDLLDPSLLFDAVLESAEVPIQLTLQEDGLQASYVIVYDALAPGGGTTTVGTLGYVVAPYDPEPFAAGSLVIDANNQQYEPQTYVVEHGAVLRVQAGDAAMVVPPNFEVGVSGGQTTLDWTLPSLSGASGSLSGSDTATVVSLADPDRIDLEATAARLTVSIPTLYPDVWVMFLDRQLRDAGLEAATDYSVQAAGTGVTMSVLGLTAADTDPVTSLPIEDLFLKLRQATIELDLRSSG
jgi:hypothetical protein